MPQHNLSLNLSGGDAASITQPDLSGITVTPSSGPMTGNGVEVVITNASGLDVGVAITVDGVATPCRRISATSVAIMMLAVIASAVGAKTIRATNPNSLYSEAAAAYTYKATGALSFTSMTSLLAVKANYPTATVFQAVDSSANVIGQMILDSDGALLPFGDWDATKLHLFLDDAAYQFADITGSSGLTVDSDGVTADFATGGGVYLKGFKASAVGRSVRARVEIIVGNATPSTNDSFFVGWVTDPTAAYLVEGGGPFFNGANWRQSRNGGASVASPTITSASSNMVVTPSAVAFEAWAMWSSCRQCELGTESKDNGGNKLTGANWALADDGSLSHVTCVTTTQTTGKPWFFAFGARSASAGTARMRLKKIQFNFGGIT